MAVEEPYITRDGRVGWAWRITEAELADIFMAQEMYAASPDGEAERHMFYEGLPDVSVTISGHWDAPDSDGTQESTH